MKKEEIVDPIVGGGTYVDNHTRLLLHVKGDTRECTPFPGGRVRQKKTEDRKRHKLGSTSSK